MTKRSRARGCAGSHYPFLTEKERDTETGLDYFEARYFASNQGRFTSTDPLISSAHVGVPQSWNRYAYALNNPLRFIDPNGLEAMDLESEVPDMLKQEKQKPTPAQEPKPPEGPIDKVTINANDTQILNFGVNLIDKVDHYGDKRVPVGGEFEIMYSYATTLPPDGSDPSSLGRIAPVTTKTGEASKGTLGSAQQVERVGDPVVVVNPVKERVEVTKTEKFRVLRDQNSTNGGTWVINYQIVVSSPTSGQVVRASTLDKKSVTGTGKIPKPVPVINRIKRP